ncbi:MAG: TldD/PmbA family protein [candidate division Zixibacteria bacterium]
MDIEQFGREIIKEALASGAEEADVLIQSGRESEISTRMKQVENIKEATSEGYGIRAFKNKQLGFCFSSDFSSMGLKEAARQAVDLSRETTSDQFNGLPESEKNFVPANLDIFDPAIGELSTEWKIDSCLTMERTMFDFDKRITNSEGAGFYDGETTTVLVNSHGQTHSYKSSYCYLVCKPVAAEDGKLQGGWWYSYKRHLDDLDSPENIGRIAAERAVRMLGAKTPGTARVPVVFDQITGTAVLGGLLAAVDGDAVFKKATCLTDKLGQDIASPLVTLIDDGTLKKGLASSPFDGEGLQTGRREIISRGNLKSYLYDVYTARKAGTVSTANAQRDNSSLPSIGSYNFYMQSGDSDFERIIESVESGLYLTGLMGSGTNPVTGDFSLGASGIWIEKGKLAYPVEGVTVASNLLEILKNIDMVGNDLEFQGPVSCPTFRVAEMTVSGTV